MILTSDCTVFQSFGKGFESRYIPSCHWVENDSAAVSKTGKTNADGVSVYVPPEYQDFCPENPISDMIVKGRCDFVFDNTDEKTVSESMREFRKQYRFFTVTAVERKLYGVGADHIKVVAV